MEGILPDQPVTVVDVSWHGTQAVTLIYKRADGQPSTRMLYRDDEATPAPGRDSRRWPFDADGALFRLVAEAYRIHLAHLFDPVLAVHTSLIEPLPHQITAVYEEMLPRQPLRFLLADDPGAGKTIMAGLLIKELMVRGDVKRCLIFAPGNLADQWQDELWFKFQLPFEILTRETFETAVQPATPSWKKTGSSCAWTRWRATTTWKARLRTASGTWSSSTKRTRCRPPFGAAN